MKLIVPLILVVSLVISGCVNDFSPESLVKNSPQVQDFLQEHPNAVIKVIYLSEDQVRKNIETIREQCGEEMEIKEYYKVTMTEGDSIIIAYVDPDNQQIAGMYIYAAPTNLPTLAPTTVNTVQASPTPTALPTTKLTEQPSILLTKEVDKSSVDVGEVIRVTIKAMNVGNSLTKYININPGITPGFTLKSVIYSTYPTELTESNTYTQMYIYEIKAEDSGTFTLNPATITYYSLSHDKEYTFTSNTPKVTVIYTPTNTPTAQPTSTATVEPTATATTTATVSPQEYLIRIENYLFIPVEDVVINVGTTVEWRNFEESKQARILISEDGIWPEEQYLSYMQSVSYT